MNRGKEFLDGKEKALHALAKAKDTCEVDEGIVTLVNLINQTESYYTSSSCAGRVLVIDVPSLGDKRNAVFLGRWHRKVTMVEIQNVVDKTSNSMIWFLAQAPIIHITCSSLEAADRFVKLANASGFKNSAIRSITKKIVVEVASTERLDTPLCAYGRLLYSLEHLEILVEIANQIMERAQDKIKRLENKIREI